VCALFQRAGRAARGRDNTGEFLWLVDSWCFGSRTEDQSKQLQHFSQSRQAKADVERRTELHLGL
jgi:hypothetical protein